MFVKQVMRNTVSNHLTINAQPVPEPTPLSFNIFFHMMPNGMKYLCKQQHLSGSDSSQLLVPPQPPYWQDSTCC